MAHTWQLQEPMDAVVFDCDGTLSMIEGIDQLAEKNGVGEEVKNLTQEAMGRSGMSDDIYKARLELVNPTSEQVVALANDYFHHLVPHVAEVINTFQRLKKTVFIVSAGLHPAVQAFAELLSVPKDNVHAVKIFFDENGKYTNYEHTTPLVHREGKRFFLTEIKLQHPKILYIGDGMNDFAACDLATRFVGFGGAYFHEKIASQSQFYIKDKSMASLLPLGLTHQEWESLHPEEVKLYEHGLKTIESGTTIIR